MTKSEDYKIKFEKIFRKLTKGSQIHECSMHIENTSGDFSWNMGYGGRTIDSPMILTSVSKLFTTTCIVNLKEQGKLSFQDTLSNFFTPEVLKELHIFKGKDYSNDLTVGNLLFQTTGFPDVCNVGKDCLDKQFIRHDIDVSFEDYVRLAKENKKKFAPETSGKAHYSDFNFEMLGKIIEQLEDSSLHDAYKRYVFTPLDLQSTYMPEDDSYFIPSVYYKDKALYRPNFIRSFPASGGCISTSKEVMIFLKAFFCGKLFDKRVFSELRKFAIIYAPPVGQYGGGFMRLNISGSISLYRCKGELIGHMGGSGAYAFYYPERDLYFVGDVNQLASPEKAFTVLLQLAKIVSR